MDMIRQVQEALEELEKTIDKRNKRCSFCDEEKMLISHKKGLICKECFQDLGMQYIDWEVTIAKKIKQDFFEKTLDTLLN